MAALSARRAREWRDAILEALAEQPCDKIALSKILGIPPGQRAALRELLVKMEAEGRIARIKRDRYCLPQEADLVTGTIYFRMGGSARLEPEEGGQSYHIAAENTWTAMHGDRVVARIMTERCARETLGVPPARPQARVIRILSRANETLVGTLQHSKNFYYVVADDPRFVHNVYVPAPTPPLLCRPGDKVVIRLEAWTSRHINPEGKIIEVLGPANAPGVDMLSIIKKYRLPLEFPPDVLREAESIPPTISKRELENREDLRRQFIFTIDPDDARDFDDAIQVERRGKGWAVGVHIADVSHYVRPRTALDREAYSRGNSTYLADRVIPMLPEALSNGICSLRPEEDRLAFSVFAEITEGGSVRNVRFAKSVIRSAVRLTYKEAYKHLSRPPTDSLSQTLHTAWEAASLLRKRRFQHGSLDLDFPEVKVWLDSNGRPKRLERIENDISHQLIEEFMLMANECVARELRLRHQPAPYRVHEDPDPDNLSEYRELLLAHGYRVGDLTQRKEIQKLLAKIKGTREEQTLKIGLLKSLKRARYSPDPLGHYGLAKSDYTHFTSPIRRYADLLVHRALERLLGLGKYAASSDSLASITEHISNTERISADAEKESVRLKKLEYFQMQATRKGQTFPAVIIDVRNFGFFVELPEFLITGLVHMSALDDDFYIYDAARARLIGRRHRRVYRTGDKISVTVSHVDLFKQQVDFRPA